jgi:hypothetical protein
LQHLFFKPHINIITIIIMSTSAIIPEPVRLPGLPPEIVLQILKENTQKEECWVNLLSKGKSPCGEHDGDYTEIIYTASRESSAPSFRSIPKRHECIFTHPVADGKIDVGQTSDKSWEVSLRLNRLRNQLNVYERTVDPDLVDNVRSLCALLNEQDVSIIQLRLMCQRFLVLYKDITESLPFTDDVYGGPDEVRPFDPSSGARNKRLRPSDDLLECQRLKHVMIRTSPCEGPSHDLIDRVFDEADPSEDLSQGPLIQSYFRMILSERKVEDDEILLDLDWSLLSGLESLCLDLTTAKWDKSHEELETWFINMQRHLKLKTLVVLGIQMYKIPKGSHILPCPLKCLQPGGKLHILQPRIQI